MLNAVSLISVALGMSGAAIAERRAAYNDILEVGAGMLLIGGLLLLGTSLPVML